MHSISCKHHARTLNPSLTAHVWVLITDWTIKMKKHFSLTSTACYSIPCIGAWLTAPENITRQTTISRLLADPTFENVTLLWNNGGNGPVTDRRISGVHYSVPCPPREAGTTAADCGPSARLDPKKYIAYRLILRDLETWRCAFISSRRLQISAAAYTVALVNVSKTPFHGHQQIHSSLRLANYAILRPNNSALNSVALRHVV